MSSEFKWGYESSDGPSVWAKHYPAGKGVRQSPIDIDPAAVTWDSELKKSPLQFSYPLSCSRTITDNGHSVMVQLDEAETTLQAGPLGNDTYHGEQFHFHWGSSESKGSEHTIKGAAFPAEMHLVHFNGSKHANFAEASRMNDGLAVLGVFLELSNTDNPAYAPIINAMHHIHHKGDTTKLTNIDLSALLPEDTECYWTYLGSLTTPPLYESVRWIVFRQPVKISHTQLSEFRELLAVNKDKEEVHLWDNFRPVQPLNGREVSCSFRWKDFACSS